LSLTFPTRPIKSRTNRLARVASVACFGLLLVLLIGCGKSVLDTETPVMDRSQPNETSYNIKLSEFKDEHLDYIIEAQKMERFTDRRMLYGYGVTLTSYDRNKQVSSVIKADTTIVDDARNIIFASGRASFFSPGGGLKTDRIAWDRNVDEITAMGKVTLTRDGSVLWGKNLRTNSKLSFAEMEAVSAEGIVNEKDIDW